MSTVVIVGAGPGLGLSLAEKFGRKNFDIALVARTQDTLERLGNSLSERGVRSAGFAADVTQERQIAEAFSRIRETFGRIDVLIYNAGVIAPVSAAETTAQLATDHLQVNIIGGISSAQQVIPEMLERQEGTILFTGGGGTELTVTPILTTLSIGKSGLRSYAHCLHEELADQGIYVGMLSIAGVIEEGTHFSPGRIADEYVDMYEKRDLPERFYGEDSEDADAALKDTYSSGAGA